MIATRISAPVPATFPKLRRASILAGDRHENHDDDEDDEHEQRDLPRTLRIFTLNGAGDAIHHRLETARAVVIREQPHGCQYVLERLLRVVGMNDEISKRVAWNLARA